MFYYIFKIFFYFYLNYYELNRAMGRSTHGKNIIAIFVSSYKKKCPRTHVVPPYKIEQSISFVPPPPAPHKKTVLTRLNLRADIPIMHEYYI